MTFHFDVVAGYETLFAIQFGSIPIHIVLHVQDLKTNETSGIADWLIYVFVVVVAEAVLSLSSHWLRRTSQLPSILGFSWSSVHRRRSRWSHAWPRLPCWRWCCEQMCVCSRFSSMFLRKSIPPHNRFRLSSAGAKTSLVAKICKDTISHLNWTKYTHIFSHTAHILTNESQMLAIQNTQTHLHTDIKYLHTSTHTQVIHHKSSSQSTLGSKPKQHVHKYNIQQSRKIIHCYCYCWCAIFRVCGVGPETKIASDRERTHLAFALACCVGDVVRGTIELYTGRQAGQIKHRSTDTNTHCEICTNTLQAPVSTWCGWCDSRKNSTYICAHTSHTSQKCCDYSTVSGRHTSRQLSQNTRLGRDTSDVTNHLMMRRPAYFLHHHGTRAHEYDMIHTFWILFHTHPTHIMLSSILCLAAYHRGHTHNNVLFSSSLCCVSSGKAAVLCVGCVCACVSVSWPYVWLCVCMCVVKTTARDLHT